MANLLRHERFERSPVALPKRRRGPLPRGVTSIKSVSRIKVGVLAQIIGGRTKQNDGIRVLITDFDPKSPHCWECKSLDRPIRCSDGALDKVVWFKSAQLRRLWTGLGERECIQLRMLREAP